MIVLSFEGELVLFAQQQDYLVATYLLDVPLQLLNSLQVSEAVDGEVLDLFVGRVQAQAH